MTETKQDRNLLSRRAVGHDVLVVSARVLARKYVECRDEQQRWFPRLTSITIRGPPVKQRVREFWRVRNGHRGETWHFGTAPRNGSSNQRVDGRGAGDRGRRQNPFESCGFGNAHEKTPGTLALGVSCQPVGSESSLPIERLPDMDSNHEPSG
jgi:hypothetical protein